MSKRRPKTFAGKAIQTVLGIFAPKVLDVLSPDASVEDIIKAVKGDPDITADQKLALEAQIIEAVATEEAAVSERWRSDAMSDSWMSKNIRPLTYGTFTVLTFGLMIADFMSTELTLSTTWIEFIGYNFGLMTFAYFGGRTWEKLKKINR